MKDNPHPPAPGGATAACQLYLISPPVIAPDFAAILREALSSAPVAAFQFRVKDGDQHELARIATPLQAVCAELGTAFIVNDSIALAKRLGADGVHLGQGDGDPIEARDVLGRDAQIGVTCHGSRHLAMEAGEANVDYVAFGAFFPSTTKVTQHVADIDLLTWWSGLFEIPCVAIGGITPSNVAPLAAAGADFVAVGGGVWHHPRGASDAVKEFAAILGL
jgi:thiamine-phosphate pyrophosphorylase